MTPGTPLLPSTDETSTRCPQPDCLEHLDRGLDLHKRRNEIRLDGGLVGPQLARAERRALADAGVDDHAVDPAELVGQLGEHLRHLLVVVDVERGDGDRDAGVTLEQFGLELVEPVGAAGAQRQVTALGGELRGPCPRPGPSSRR